MPDSAFDNAVDELLHSVGQYVEASVDLRDKTKDGGDDLDYFFAKEYEYLDQCRERLVGAIKDLFIAGRDL